jgi:hypothetical protein
MPKYKVQITKYIEHSDTVEVKAINDLEAKKMVRMMATNEDRDNVKRLRWSENEKPRFKLEISNN